MRIIAGVAKGRRLTAPKAGTRPFTGRAKEAVFSSLQHRIADARVLDLYAGSGSLGLEALSRGASSVVFVEKAVPAISVLKENVSAVGLGGRIVRSDVGAHLGRDRAIYDLVFADPPYAATDEEVADVLRLVGDRLAEDGIIVLHRRAGGMEPVSDNLRCTDRRRYGDSEIWILEKEQE